MLVYSHRDEPIAPPCVLADLLRDAVEVSKEAAPSHDRLVHLLISFGELESAILDALCPERDDDVPLARQCRRAAITIADAVVASWRGKVDDVSPALSAFIANLRGIDVQEVPSGARRRIAEGYAYYAVYPEAYADAALQFWQEVRPPKVCCIGIRSTGASLSGVVAAALRSRGSTVEAVTVRPRGAPQDRVLRLTTRLHGALVPGGDWYFAVVDDGPGQSGSTAAAVVSHLARRSIPDSRVVLFASHPVDPDTLASAEARKVWGRTRVYLGGFERLGLTGALANDGELTDWSGGRWRNQLYDNAAHYPAVHPQHERRKYLVRARQRSLLRFAGVGHYGRTTYERACALADTGFTPPADGIENGFLRLRFIPGRPASADDVSCPLLDRMASYAAHLQRHQRTGRDSEPTTLVEMTVCNIAEVVGHERTAGLCDAVQRLLAFDPAAEVAVDGRLLPHEWIATGSTFVKTDAVDHHRDDFFPGATDVAWDLAGMAVEWGLSQDAERYLLEKYCRESNDNGLHRRLPFFRLAYLAYRLGYAVEAGKVLRGLPDAARFAALAQKYRARLLTEIEQGNPV
jgi:hypothetical protein